MFKINLPQMLKGIISTCCNDEPEEVPEMPSCPETCSFQEVDIAASNYGVATVRMSQCHSGEKASTPAEVERILKNFLGDDRYKISQYKELFSNLDKLDYQNIDRHLKNIKIFMGMTSNFPETIIKNGYFYSEEGALAFESLASFLSAKSSSGYVAPLCIALGNYDPKTVLILKKRGLLDEKGIDNRFRLTKLASMSDEKYESFQKKVDDSIRQTGFSFEELSAELLKQTRPLMNDHTHEFFERNCINKESVVSQLELLKLLKSFPLEFKDYQLGSILHFVDVDNIESYRNVLSVLKNRSDITQYSVSDILSVANKVTESILSDLLLNEDIPINKIVEYCTKDKDFQKGLIPFETILENINNDSFLRTVRLIENSNIDLTPQNTNPTELNPHNIESRALALVHMTDYNPENGTILSTRDKLKGSRNSVHFTLNHSVISHHFGDWEQKKYAIIMPYDSTIAVNGNDKFIEGMPNDLYTNGSVLIPEGAVIVEYNPDIPSGQAIIKNSSELKGVKQIESSIYPHQLVPSVLKKMGYSHLQAGGPIGLFSYGKNNGQDVDAAVENYFAWKNFGDNNGIKPTRHTGSAGDIAEAVVENVGKLCVKNSWFGGKDSAINYKEELLYYLETIKPWQDMGYFVSYDLDSMINLIEQSSTPKDAVCMMNEKFGFHPTIKYERFNEIMFSIPIDLYSTWHDISDNPLKLREHIEKEKNI